MKFGPLPPCAPFARFNLGTCNLPTFGHASVSPFPATLTRYDVTITKHATLSLFPATLTDNVAISPLFATLTKNTGGGVVASHSGNPHSLTRLPETEAEAENAASEPTSNMKPTVEPFADSSCAPAVRAFLPRAENKGKAASSSGLGSPMGSSGVQKSDRRTPRKARAWRARRIVQLRGSREPGAEGGEGFADEALDARAAGGIAQGERGGGAVVGRGSFLAAELGV